VPRALGCKRALLPRASGAFCAMGMLQSDVRQDYLKVFLADLDKVEAGALDTAFAELETRAGDARLKEREFDLRYDGQQWPVRVALDDLDTTGVRAKFEAEHQRLYGHIQPHGRIDITALRVIGRTPLDWTPPAARSPQTLPPTPRETRKVWIDAAHGWHDVPVYDGDSLRPGCKLPGPLLIEERTTTAFIGPRDLLEVDARDDFLVHIGANP
jgi:N-methylhydantoinase A